MPLEPEIHLVLGPSVDTVEDLGSVVSGRSSCDDVRQIMVGWERKKKIVLSRKAEFVTCQT